MSAKLKKLTERDTDKTTYHLIASNEINTKTSQVALDQEPSIDFHSINYAFQLYSLFVNDRWTD